MKHALRSLLLTLLSRSYVEVKSCTSLELHSLASRDLDLLLRLRIDTLTSRLFIYREGTEAEERDLLTLLEFFCYNGSESFDGLASIYLREVSYFSYACDKFCLVHKFCCMGCTKLIRIRRELLEYYPCGNVCRSSRLILFQMYRFFCLYKGSTAFPAKIFDTLTLINPP